MDKNQKEEMQWELTEMNKENEAKDKSISFSKLKSKLWGAQDKTELHWNLITRIEEK